MDSLGILSDREASMLLVQERGALQPSLEPGMGWGKSKMVAMRSTMRMPKVERQAIRVMVVVMEKKKKTLSLEPVLAGGQAVV
jgi:hypothetical protein